MYASESRDLQLLADFDHSVDPTRDLFGEAGVFHRIHAAVEENDAIVHVDRDVEVDRAGSSSSASATSSSISSSPRTR